MGEQRGYRRAQREQRLQAGVAGLMVRERDASRARSRLVRWNCESATRREEYRGSRCIAMDLAHEVGRTPAHFEVDAADVLANQAERKKNESDESEQDREQDPQRALFLRPKIKPMASQENHQQRIEQEDSDSQQAKELDRDRAKSR